MMLSHHGALDKLKLFHLEDGGFHHQRDYKILIDQIRYILQNVIKFKIVKLRSEEHTSEL